jgi:hypothetical protein
MSAAEPSEAAPATAAEEEEEIDYDSLSFTDPRYWEHFYDEEDLDFYEARTLTEARRPWGRGIDAQSCGGCLVLLQLRALTLPSTVNCTRSGTALRSGCTWRWTPWLRACKKAQAAAR